jgi:hypothetical protein
VNQLKSGLWIDPIERLDFCVVISFRLPPGSRGNWVPDGPATGDPVGMACSTFAGTVKGPVPRSAVHTNQLVAVVPCRPALKEVMLLKPAMAVDHDHCADGRSCISQIRNHYGIGSGLSRRHSPAVRLGDGEIGV